MKNLEQLETPSTSIPHTEIFLYTHCFRSTPRYSLHLSTLKIIILIKCTNVLNKKIVISK